MRVKAVARVLLALFAFGAPLAGCKRTSLDSNKSQTKDFDAVDSNSLPVEINQNLQGQALAGFKAARYGDPNFALDQGAVEADRPHLLIARPMLFDTAGLQKLYGMKTGGGAVDEAGLWSWFNSEYLTVFEPGRNDNAPLGITRVGVAGNRKYFFNCLVCHTGNVPAPGGGTRPWIGAPNQRLRMTQLFRDIQAMWKQPGMPADFRRDEGLKVLVGGPNDPNLPAGVTQAALFSWIFGLQRTPDLEMRNTMMLGYELMGVRKHLMAVNPPAWWWIKGDDPLYANGLFNNDSLRTRKWTPYTIMQMYFSYDNNAAFLRSPEFEENAHQIQALVQAVQPPNYPFEIDVAAAREGCQLFKTNCMSCHDNGGFTRNVGTDPTYDEDWTGFGKVWGALRIYPKDETRESFIALSEQMIAQRNHQQGFGYYKAPPLTGQWTRQVIFHNSSSLLNESVTARPRTGEYCLTGDFDNKLFGPVVKLRTDLSAAEQGHFQENCRYEEPRIGLTTKGHMFDVGPDVFGAGAIAKLESTDVPKIYEYLKTRTSVPTTCE